MSGSAPKASKPRVAIDTNLFVSGLIGRGAPQRLLDAWDRGAFLLVISPESAAEVSDVVRRPSIRDKYQLTDERIRGLEQGIQRTAEIVANPAPLPADIDLRDPKDVHVLQTALGGRGDYLITGDKDLLDLHGHPSLGQLQIVTVNAFLAVLAQ